MLRYAEQISLGVGQCRPLNVGHLIEHVPSMRGTDREEALDFRRACTPTHREVDVDELGLGTQTLQRLEGHRDPVRPASGPPHRGHEGVVRSRSTAGIRCALLVS